MTFVANCRDVFFPSPSRRPLLVFADSVFFTFLLSLLTSQRFIRHFETYGLPNLWFACGLPFTKPTEIMKTTKTTTLGAKKINANFFCTKFFNNPSGHGRPRRKPWTPAPKSAFSCGPGGREKPFDPWARKVKNVRGKSGPKSLCLCCFFFCRSFKGQHD